MLGVTGLSSQFLDIRYRWRRHGLIDFHRQKTLLPEFGVHPWLKTTHRIHALLQGTQNAV